MPDPTGLLLLDSTEVVQAELHPSEYRCKSPVVINNCQHLLMVLCIEQYNIVHKKLTVLPHYWSTQYFSRLVEDCVYQYWSGLTWRTSISYNTVYFAWTSISEIPLHQVNTMLLKSHRGRFWNGFPGRERLWNRTSLQHRTCSNLEQSNHPMAAVSLRSHL